MPIVNIKLREISFLANDMNEPIETPYKIERSPLLNDIMNGPNGNQVIEASAGTGKTYMIKKIFFELVYQGVSPKNILVVTFTRDATAELKSRLNDQITSSLIPSKDEIESSDSWQDYWEINDAKRSLIQKSKEQFSECVISTLDSLTQRILRDNPEQTKAYMQPDIMTKVSTKDAFAHFMRECVPHDDLLTGMAIAYQTKYEKRDLEPLIDTYNAVSYLRTDLDKICNSFGQSISFPIKYYEQIQSDLKGEDWNDLPDHPEKLFTYYRSWCEKLSEAVAEQRVSLDELGQFLQTLYPSSRASTRDQQIDDFKQYFIDKDIAKDAWLCISNELTRADLYFSIYGKTSQKISNEDKVKTLLTSLKESPKDSWKSDLSKMLLMCFPKEYFLEVYVKNKYLPYIQREKARSNKFVFNDFTEQLRASIAISPSSETESLEDNRQKLIRNVRKHWKYIIVDEFQDTSESQWEILKSMFLEALPDESAAERPRMFLIGDPKQAIYGFRGCDIFIYRTAKAAILGAQTPITLDANHRSSKIMIDAVNHMYEDSNYSNKNEITYASESKGLFVGSVDANALTDDEKEKVNIYQFIHAGINASKCWTNGRGQTLPPIVCFEQQESQTKNTSDVITAEAMANEIDLLLHPEKRQSADDPYMPVQPIESVYILARTKKTFQDIRTSLTRRNIPFTDVDDGGSAFLLEENLALFRIMRAIERPTDDRLLADALNTMLFGMTLAEVTAELSQQYSASRECFKRWGSMSRNPKSFRKLFDDILETTQARARMALFSYTSQPYKHLLEMIDTLLQQAFYDHMTWSQLVNWYLESAQSEESKTDDDGGSAQKDCIVHFMTIHKSKGLQADAVFILNQKSRTSPNDIKYYHEKIDGHWQTRTCVKSDIHIADSEFELALEEERLLYVAITRAKHRLYLSFDNQKKENDKKKDKDDANKLRNDVLTRLQNRLRLLKEENHSEFYEFRQISDDDVQLSTSDNGDLMTHLNVIKSEYDHRSKTASEMQDNKDLYYIYDKKTRHNLSYSLLTRRDKSRRVGCYPVETEQPTVELYPHLKRGSETGLYAHEVLEKIDYKTIKCARNAGLTAENWIQDNTIKVISEAKDLIHRLGGIYKMTSSEEFREISAMVFNALTAKLSIEGRTLCLCDATRHISELEFLSTGDGVREHITKEGKVSIMDHDMFNGSIDCCCCFETQTGDVWYLIDWKTDTLPDYSHDFMKVYVYEHYYYQFNIYVNVFKKWLRNVPNSRFGGMMYVFLRGVNADGNQGIYHYSSDDEDRLAYDD